MSVFNLRDPARTTGAMSHTIWLLGEPEHSPTNGVTGYMLAFQSEIWQ